MLHWLHCKTLGNFERCFKRFLSSMAPSSATDQLIIAFTAGSGSAVAARRFPRVRVEVDASENKSDGGDDGRARPAAASAVTALAIFARSLRSWSQQER